MIAIESQSGELVKILKFDKESILGFHKLFGPISSDNADRRMTSKKREGVDFLTNDWLCQFSARLRGDKLELTGIESCKTKKLADNAWELITGLGTYKITNIPSAVIADGSISHQSEIDNALFDKTAKVFMFILLLAIPFLYFLKSEEVVEEEKKVIEAITVKVIKPVNTVKISKSSKDLKIKPLTKNQKSKRAVKRNLGFLELVGTKTASKVVGGLPTKLARATAGAGAGGDAGSGGEVLTGLGKGLKKITVGNTGVAGLGGVGTKGAGGGKGGYGTTRVASGEGVGVSGISVGSNDMVLDGGLSRYAINATIAKYLSQVRRCYENELNRNPDIEGLVSVAFEIGGSGKLNYSRVTKSSLGNKKVEKCITTKMMNWKFPKPKGGVNVKVNYPFMLRPVGT